MATIDEIRKGRLKKLEAIKKAGFLAYPAEVKRTHKISEALEDFSKLFKQEKEIIVTGRISAQRTHGKATFLNVEDETGALQIFLAENAVGPKPYKFFVANFDLGDFLQTRGILFKTKTNEKTLKAADFKILAKSIRPLPEKWYGLKDVEERFRKRYLDLILNKNIKENFKLRSKIITEIRNFLDSEGFLEVETPILQPVYGGASAKPFKTHLNALDMDLYLRIAPELYLKRLLVGGIEKVYELGKCFRNEGMDKSHNPDFTMLEFYWAYADYKDLMELTEKMFSSLLKKVLGKTEIIYEGKKINFKTPWPRIEYADVIKKYAKIDIEGLNEKSIVKKAQELGIRTEGNEGKMGAIDQIYKKACLPKIWEPTFVVNHPVGMLPLAKPLDNNPEKAASFQLIAAGWELVKAYCELNDPILQKKRFEEQEKNYKKGLEESQRMDEDFIEALEYGMPPAAGFGLGIDRLVALLTDSHALREIIFFPTMKPR